MGVSADRLLGRPVRAHGIRLGLPVDVILAPADGRRALGLDVLCGDGVHRFLPISAAQVGDDAIDVASTMMLLRNGELEYYRERGSTLRSLRGGAVERRGEAVGTLADLVLGAGGAIEAVVVRTADGELELPYQAGVELP